MSVLYVDVCQAYKTSLRRPAQHAHAHKEAYMIYVLFVCVCVCVFFCPLSCAATAKRVAQIGGWSFVGCVRS